MDAFKVVNCVNKVLISQSLPQLTERQRVIVRAAWDEITFDQALQVNPICSCDSLRVDASDLWPYLSAVLKRKVGKRNFRRVLLETNLLGDLAAPPEPVPALPSRLPEGDLPQFLGLIPPDRFPFYGREFQIQSLASLLERNRVIEITGIEGIGKRSLVWKTLTTWSIPYKRAVWQPLSGKQRSAEIARSLLRALHPDLASVAEQDLSDTLIQCLLVEPHLVVLEGLDGLLQWTGRSSILPQDVARFLTSLVQETHSTFVLISQFPLREIDRLKLKGIAVEHFPVPPLGTADCRRILGEYNLDDESLWDELILSTGGHPLLLRQIASWSQSRWNRRLKGLERVTLQVAELGFLYDELFSDPAHLSDADRVVLRRIAEQAEVSEEDLIRQVGASRSQLDRLIQAALVTVRYEGDWRQYRIAPLLRKYLQQGAELTADAGET